MINSENGQIRSLVAAQRAGTGHGNLRDEARQTLDQQLTLPAGYSLQLSGQYEDQIHARQRLQIVVPLVLVIIFVIIYFTFRSAVEALL